jgi:predicted ATPase/DNA-binding XRE family transcriptional regulator
MNTATTSASFFYHGAPDPEPPPSVYPRLARPSFGALLKRHRAAAGFSQEVLAERARVSLVTVGSLERESRRAPYRETVALLADALGLGEPDREQLEKAAAQARGRFQRRSPDPTLKHNLPAQVTSFIGRAREIAEIVALFERYRLVTIVGSGGVGKTRTALEAAAMIMQRRDEDVHFVDLASCSDLQSVTSAISSVTQTNARVERPADLTAALQTRRALMILDNCEQVLEEIALTTRGLLESCPGIVIFVTSRQRLGIPGEATYRLPPLAVPLTTPATMTEALSYGAIELFIQRAEAADATFAMASGHIPAVTDLCKRLDGIPLAIELAAARLPMLGLAALQERLWERFVLAGGAHHLPPRQQTMLATIAWSYNLLNDAERILFRRLSIFSGGNTLEAAEAVCADDLLHRNQVGDVLLSLIEKSLVNVVRADGRVRYTMLESVRFFASEKLADANELLELTQRHAQRFEAFAGARDVQITV